MDCLEQWLAHCERLHPQTIVLGLERVGRVATRLGLRFHCPVVTVGGTNGKGSSCAMLESIARQAGYRVGVYTSPHLIHFLERCRLQGQAITEAELLPYFEKVELAREEEVLTYFEFTTLVILAVLAQAQLDLVVLEVGLGGRLDAVNIVDADCALITSIALDHTEWLGPDRDSIGREKAGVMRAGRPVVVSDPEPPSSLAECAENLGADLWQLGRDFLFSGERQQWQWSASPERGGRRYAGLAYPALRGANQLANAAGVFAVFEALRARLPVNAQALRQGLATVELTGRFQVLPGQPVQVLDVAHNPHAVAALTENLDAMGFFPATHAVFGAMADKDISAMVERISPLIDHWHVCSLPTPRAASAQALREFLREQKLRTHVRVTCYESPQAALVGARSHAHSADRIVVFGSFYTVGGVLAQSLS